jgi:hypothetical protein
MQQQRAAHARHLRPQHQLRHQLKASQALQKRPHHTQQQTRLR